MKPFWPVNAIKFTYLSNLRTRIEVFYRSRSTRCCASSWNGKKIPWHCAINRAFRSSRRTWFGNILDDGFWLTTFGATFEPSTFHLPINEERPVNISQRSSVWKETFTRTDDEDDPSSSTWAVVKATTKKSINMRNQCGLGSEKKEPYRKESRRGCISCCVQNEQEGWSENASYI